jgi:Zn-dependent protease with chaperone function
MKFCVNCGVQYQGAISICQRCFWDPEVPRQFIEQGLAEAALRRRWSREPRLGFPGERMALALSLAVCTVVVGILGVATLGVLLLVLLLNVAMVVVDQCTVKKKMVEVSESQFSKVYRISKVAAHRLGLELMPVYVTENANYNAYTMGFCRRGYIVLHSALACDFGGEELLFVVGHELGHVRAYHTTLLNLMGPVGTLGRRLFVAPLMRAIFNVWSVKAEYTADQAGLVASRSLGGTVAALLKLAGGVEAAKQMEFVDFERLLAEEPDAKDTLLEYFGTHPFLWNRIRQIVAFYRGPVYHRAVGAVLSR